MCYKSRAHLLYLLSTGCVEKEYIISLNETITPPELVQASSSLGMPFQTPFRNALYFGQNGQNNDLHTWCTASSDPDPYVVINFNLSVAITGFLSSGSTYLAGSQNNIFYVTNFTLEYAERNSSGELNFVYYKNRVNQDVKVGLFHTVYTNTFVVNHAIS